MKNETKTFANAFTLATCDKTRCRLVVIFGKNSETLTIQKGRSNKALSLTRAVDMGLDSLRPLLAVRARYADYDRGQLCDLVGSAADEFQPTAEDYGFDESEGAFSESITVHVEAAPKAPKAPTPTPTPKAPKADAVDASQAARDVAVEIMRARIAASDLGRVRVTYDGAKYWCHYAGYGMARLTAHHKADPHGPMGFNVWIDKVC